MKASRFTMRISEKEGAALSELSMILGRTRSDTINIVVAEVLYFLHSKGSGINEYHPIPEDVIKTVVNKLK